MSAHTPGPWVVEADRGESLMISAPDRGIVGFARMRADHGTGTAGALATARLIAAAPELLLACERMVALQNDPDKMSFAVDFARLVIAKARGTP